jgi:hypothetical protein
MIPARSGAAIDPEKWRLLPVAWSSRTRDLATVG